MHGMGKNTSKNVLHWIWIVGAVVTGMSASCAYEPPSVNTGTGGSMTASSSSNGGGSGGETSSSGGGGSVGSGGVGGGSGGASSGTGGSGAETCSTGEVCVPSAPSTWEGPYRVRSGQYGQFTEGCPDGANEVYKGFRGEMASPPCSCDCNCIGIGCTNPTVTCWDGIKCGLQMAPGTAITLNANESCYAMPTGLGGTLFGSCTVTSPSVVIPATSCTPGNALLPNVDPFQTEVQVCEMQEVGTCTGGTCTIQSEIGFPNAACVVKAGVQSCPSEYPDKQVIYQSWADGRSCDQCQAAKEAVACSAPEIQSATAACAATIAPITQDCTATNGAANIKYNAPIATMPEGACLAQVIGKVTGTEALTVCCRSL